MCISPPESSQGSEALVYRGVSSSSRRLATKLGIRVGCTSPSMPSNRRAMRSFLHMDRTELVTHLIHVAILPNIRMKTPGSHFIHKSSLSYLFISESLVLVVMPSNRFLNSETKGWIKEILLELRREETSKETPLTDGCTGTYSSEWQDGDGWNARHKITYICISRSCLEWILSKLTPKSAVPLNFKVTSFTQVFQLTTSLLAMLTVL